MSRICHWQKIYFGSMIPILPRPPLWAEPNEPNNLYISQVSKTKLYLNLLSYSDSHEFSYYLDPPWTKTKKPNINYTSRVRRNRPIFTFSEYSTAGPQSKDGSVCVTTGEGAGGVLATGQALYYLGPWPSRPPGSLPRGGTRPPIFGLRSLRVELTIGWS